jgi:hypothetical protein
MRLKENLKKWKMREGEEEWERELEGERGRA